MHRSYAVLYTGKYYINLAAMPYESYVPVPVELEEGRQNQTVESTDYIKLLRNRFVLEWKCGIVLLFAPSVKEVVAIVGSITVKLCVFALMENK